MSFWSELSKLRASWSKGIELEERGKGKAVPVAHAATPAANLLVLPDVELDAATDVTLDAWQEFPAAERAPEHAVVMFVVHGKWFVAIVVDTETDRLVWRITGLVEHFGALAIGAPGAPLIPAPPSLATVNQHGDGCDCPLCVAFAKVPNPIPKGGNGLPPEILVLSLAKLARDVLDGEVITFRAAGGTVRGAGLVFRNTVLLGNQRQRG